MVGRGGEINKEYEKDCIEEFQLARAKLDRHGEKASEAMGKGVVVL